AYPDLQNVKYDVCVIGSGAGGAVVARELSRHGKSVIVVEEGEWVSPDEMPARTDVAAPPEDYTALMRLYRHGNANLSVKFFGTDQKSENWFSRLPRQRG